MGMHTATDGKQYDRIAGFWDLGIHTSGIWLIEIEHGIEDYAYCKFPMERARKYKITYTASGRVYVRIYGKRYYFDECFRYDNPHILI